MFLLTGYGDKLHFREQQCCQCPSVHGTGINADLVFMDKGLFKDRVSENNRFAEIIGGTDKFVPDPETPVTTLPAEMHTGLQAGMDIDGVPIFSQ